MLLNKKNYNAINKWALVVLTLLMLASCSTRRNTFPNRAYHTATSKFNVNFNGKEALKEGQASLKKSAKDNYITILPIYYYPPKQELMSSIGMFDKAIEKASKSIYKHSMLIRGKEYVKTMDDAYLLMGKAYFYKQDYRNAQRVLNYIEANYRDWGLAEEAMIYNARCAIKQEQYDRAYGILDAIFNTIADKKDKKIELKFNLAQAEYQQTAPDGDLETCAEFLEEALLCKPKKEQKLRIYFILGQIYEATGNSKLATEYFTKVTKGTPSYEMEFSAQMHLAANYDGTESSKKLIMRDFNKMLEEEKNIDFKDQIYYAISEMCRIDEDNDCRKENLALSVSTSTNNYFQKTFSAITLADIYFSENEYMNAQNYYDSATMVMPKNYPNYKELTQKAGVLRELVDFLKVIDLQDSLQRIAELSAGERDAWVRKMIKEYTAEEERLKKEEADRMLALQATSNFANVNVNTTGSNDWYFYNQGLVSAGAIDFARRWGNRKLEDNWRISSKQEMSFDEMDEMNSGDEGEDEEQYDEDGNLIVTREDDPKKPAFYTQDLPLTDSLMAISDSLVADAMYNAALIYVDLLKDYKRSNETFESLLERYPNHNFAPASCYLLYTNYKHLKSIKSDEYKNIILTKYPNSDYAKLIQDPSYYKKLAEAAKTNEQKYEEAYRAYSSKNWKQTVTLCDAIIPILKKEDQLLPKFDYIKTVSKGQIFGEDTLRKSLHAIIANYPNDEVKNLAEIYLSILPPPAAGEEIVTTTDSTGQVITQTVAPEQSPFKFNADENHYVIILARVEKINVNNLKNNITDFNENYFKLYRLNSNSFYISQEEQMVTISRFRNKDAAMEYLEMFTISKEFKQLFDEQVITIYPMGASNYSTYYNKKDKRVLYNQFYLDNYLK